MRQRGALLTGGHSPSPSDRPLLIALGSREAAMSKCLLGLPSSCQLAVVGRRQSQPPVCRGPSEPAGLWGLLMYPGASQPSSCWPGFPSLQGEGRAGEPPGHTRLPPTPSHRLPLLPPLLLQRNTPCVHPERPPSPAPSLDGTVPPGKVPGTDDGRQGTWVLC